MKTKKFLKRMAISELAPEIAVCIPGYLKEKSSTDDMIKGVSQFYIDSDNRKGENLVYSASLVGCSKMIPLSRNMGEFGKISLSVNLAKGTIDYSKDDEVVNQSGEDCFLWGKYGTLYIAFTWVDKPVIAEINPDFNCLYLYHGTGELSTIASRFLNPHDHLMAKSILDVKYQLANELAFEIMKKETSVA